MPLRSCLLFLLRGDGRRLVRLRERSLWWRPSFSSPIGEILENKRMGAPNQATSDLPFPAGYHGGGGLEELRSGLWLELWVVPPLSLHLLWWLSSSSHGVKVSSSCNFPWRTACWGGNSQGASFNKLDFSAATEILEASSCRVQQRQRWSAAVSFGQRGPSALAAQDEKKERFFGVCSLNKRICCPSWGAGVVYLLLAGRGGEGEEGDASAATGFGRRRCVVSEALLKVSIGSDGQYFLQYLCCTGSSSTDGYSLKDTVPFLFGLCHRRWPTAPSLLILRFNRGDFLCLSSVKVITHLQLNILKPQVRTPERPSVESPAGHQLVWSTKEAFGDCNCSKFEPELSTDDRPLVDSICSLRYLLCKFWPSTTCFMQLSTAGLCSVVNFAILYWDP